MGAGFAQRGRGMGSRSAALAAYRQLLRVQRKTFKCPSLFSPRPFPALPSACFPPHPDRQSDTATWAGATP